MTPRPEDRYVSLDTTVLPDGRTVYRSARPKDIVPSPRDSRVVANEKARLDIFAQNVYGSPVEWWRIAAANRRVNGSLHIVPNSVVIIPSK